MAEYRKYVVRHGYELDGLLTVLKGEAEELGISRSRLISNLILALVRRLEARELDIKFLSGSCSAIVGVRSNLILNIERGTHIRMLACAAAHGVAAAELVRASIVLFKTLMERVELEKRWVNHGEPGSPRFLSDSFLRLWSRNTLGDCDMRPMEARLFAALRSVDLRVAALCEQMETFESLREYAVIGMKTSGKFPTRAAIHSLRMDELRKLSRLWDINIPQRAPIGRARDIVLKHFKYT